MRHTIMSAFRLIAFQPTAGEINKGNFLYAEFYSLVLIESITDHWWNQSLER